MNGRNVAEIIDAIVTDHRRATQRIRRRLADAEIARTADAARHVRVPEYRRFSAGRVMRSVTDPDEPVAVHEELDESAPHAASGVEETERRQRPSSWLI